MELALKEAQAWVKEHVRPELLDAWMFNPDGSARDFHDSWNDIKRARLMILCVGPEGRDAALVDLYCATYRWQLACANPSLPPKTRHETAQLQAVAEVLNTAEAV